MLHRKNTVARKIQDYFLSGDAEEMAKRNDGSWFWFPIPNNPKFCVALEWQNGYEGDEFDKKEYGRFMDGEWVINASIKFTDDFRINETYALYAETFYINEGEDLTGGTSLSEFDVKDKFFTLSKQLADDFNRFNRMKPKREL